MARLFLTPGENAEVGRTPNEVFGTNSNETVQLSADSKTTFDASFNRGGDTIKIGGNAALYTAGLSGSNLVLTAANGANIVIPVGTVGATLIFADATRSLYFDAALSKVLLGGQTIPATGSVAVTAGSGPVDPTPGDVIPLSVTLDVVDGSSADDVFRARVVQNAAGEQTNQLGTGDQLDGGAGDNDTLIATVQEASPLNAGPSSAIMAETTDVEVAHFTALEAKSGSPVFRMTELSGKGGSYGPKLGVEINAKEMNGLDEVGSVQSDNSLTIYNVNTLTDDGLYEHRRLTEEICIRMDHTGNGQLVDRAADLTVLFDQNYLLKKGDVASGSTLRIELMDLDASILGQDKLLDNPIGKITFEMGGQLKTLQWDPAPVNTYDQLVTAIQNAIAQAALTDPMMAQLSVAKGGEFLANDTDDDPVPNAPVQHGSVVVITNSGSEILVAKTMTANGDAPAGKDFHTGFSSGAPDTEGFKITSCIILNKVGRGADGGYLTVGGMATDGYNWIGGGTGQIRGVEQFNITVEGDATQPSDLAGIQSTNNALECIFVESAAGSKADLTIGNANTVGFQYNNVNYSGYGLTSQKNNALKDVLLFDATAFANDATVYAYFSTETVAKYLDLTDTDWDPKEDNVVAEYLFAGGNDFLNVNLDKSNMAVVGTETREDFAFHASMGAGNDTVEIQLSDGSNAVTGSGNYTNSMYEGSYSTGPDLHQTVQNWYYNHVLNENMRIDTGDGNDTVRTWGASNADINLGKGDDTVYADNSGVIGGFNQGKATWIFNQLNTEVNNLQSQLQAKVTKVTQLSLTVVFEGIESKVEVGDSWNSVVGVDITDLTINQAIKDAINNHPVLSKVLVAEDGPARTLIVRSLIDGEHINTDLSVSLSNEGPVPTNAAPGVFLLVGEAGTLEESLGFQAGVPFGTRYDSQFGTDGSTLLTGYDSIMINNNNIEGAEGNDVIILSSNGVGDGIGVNSATEGDSVETLDINGAFGNDTVFNFTADSHPNLLVDQWQGGLNVTSQPVYITDLDLASHFPSDGHDIFDVTTLFGGSVDAFYNDGQSDTTEGATITAMLGNMNAGLDTVIIIDTLESGQGTGTTELARIQSLVTAADAAPAAGADDGIIITVNADNTGTFYFVDNGAAKGDAVVTLLGTVELATFGDADKSLIGNWDQMDILNFTPISTNQLTNTFDIA